MAAELPRPGVEVIQVFRSVSPTVITPTLLPCIVGVAKQIVELLETDDAGNNLLNSDALITMPAFFDALDASGGPPVVYTGLDGLALVVSLNNGPDVTITFADTASAGLTPASVVSQVTSAFTTAGVTAAVSEVVGDHWRMRTVGLGDFQSIVIRPGTAGAVESTFGIGIGKTYVGISNYNQFQVDIPQTNFPDPRSNLNELVMENATIRVFLATGAGTSFKELLRTTAFLRNGVVNDPAVTTEGSSALSTLTMASETLTLALDGSSTDTTIVFGTEAGEAAILAVLNAVLVPLGVTATAGPLVGGVVLTTTATGDGKSIEVKAAGGGAAKLTMTVETVTGFNIEATDDGNGDNLTSLIRFEGEDFTAVATAATITGSGFTTPAADSTLIISDGQQPQTIVFDGTESTSTLAAAAIDAIMGAAAGGRIVAADSGGELALTHIESGTDSFIEIVGGTAVTALGHVVGITRGVPDVPLPGDKLWIDGAFFATVSEVAPGGSVDTLKVDKLVPISTDIGNDFFVNATSLPDAINRADLTPDLVVDTNGNVSIKHELLRDTGGDPVAATASIFLTYTAVRQDVTSRASQAGLLVFDNTTDLGNALDPISAANPLALGLFFALLNAPGVQVTGLGVDAVDSSNPFGTLAAFTRAAEFLEAHEIYALAPLTHDQTVGQVYKTHVDFMSEPESKGERIVLFNPVLPTRKLDTLVASGTNGNTVGSGGLTFDTGIANLTALVLAAGVSPIGTIPTTDGLFLDIASDSKSYSIESISGSVITIRITFATGDNDDGFFSTTDLNDPPLPTSLVQEAFSVKVRGAELLTVAGDTDFQTMAETIQALGQTFLDRRFWMTIPDQAAAVVDGVESILNGFYMNAAIAGMIGQNPPQQSFTNFPMAGFTRVIGTSPSNKKFTERQLNIMAAGGAYIVIQDVEGGPLFSRFALTTDLTSIETRTDSITKVVDFTAKFLRKGLRNFIGRFNITQGFLDSLGSVIQGLIGFLVETGVLIGGNLNNLIQDEDAPDTVLVDITLDVPFPANFIRLTLVV